VGRSRTSDSEVASSSFTVCSVEGYLRHTI